MLLLTLAVPSLNGLLADQRSKASFDAFDALVRQAQTKSIADHCAYVLAWDAGGISLRRQKSDETDETPASSPAPENAGHVAFGENEKCELQLTAALSTPTTQEWTFWPTGTCEPATIVYQGGNGNWTATYDPLTVRATFTQP